MMIAGCLINMKLLWEKVFTSGCSPKEIKTEDEDLQEKSPFYIPRPSQFQMS